MGYTPRSTQLLSTTTGRSLHPQIIPPASRCIAVCSCVGRPGRRRRTQTKHTIDPRKPTVRARKFMQIRPPYAIGCYYSNTFTHAKQCGVIEHTHTHRHTHLTGRGMFANATNRHNTQKVGFAVCCGGCIAVADERTCPVCLSR